MFSNRWGSGRNKSLAASAKHYANSQSFEHVVLEENLTLMAGSSSLRTAMRGSALIGMLSLNLCALRFRRFMRICWSMRNCERG